MRSRLAGIVQITVIEGSKSQVFHIARNLLDSKAPTFMSAIDPTEHAKRTAVQLTDVRIEVFDHFVDWIEGRFYGYNWLLLSRIYVFGDNYGIHTLRDFVLDKIEADTTSFKKLCKSSPLDWIDSEMAIYVYGNTSDKSPLRNILVDFFCMFTSPLSPNTAPILNLSAGLNQYPKDFLVDVMIQRLSAATFEQYCKRVAGANEDYQQDEYVPNKKRKGM